MIPWLLVLIAALLWQIHGELHRTNSHLFGESDPGISLFPKKSSQVGLTAFLWATRGTVAAVILGLVWCAFYINR